MISQINPGNFLLLILRCNGVSLAYIYDQTFSIFFILYIIVFRFAAEIRSRPGNYLSSGYITNYIELIDVANNFNPNTGVFTVGYGQDGTYVFYYSGPKGNKKTATLNVYKNKNSIQNNHVSFTTHRLQFNGMVTVKLRKGDYIRLHNAQNNALGAAGIYPFTFTGYLID